MNDKIKLPATWIYPQVIKGWVIMTDCHPNSGNPYVHWSSFSEKRKEAIEIFLAGTTTEWQWWRKKYGFKAVKAESTISINQTL
jgi:hypothetical protein